MPSPPTASKSTREVTRAPASAGEWQWRERPLRESFSQLHLEYVQRLDANGQPNQPVGDPLLCPLVRIDVAVRGRAGMAARGAGVAKRRAERDAFGLAHEAVDGIA